MIHYILTKKGKRVQVRAIPHTEDGRAAYGLPSRPPGVLYRLSIDEEKRGAWVMVREYGPGPWEEIKARLAEVLNLYRANGWIQE
jgi:hypothetical protein